MALTDKQQRERHSAPAVGQEAEGCGLKAGPCDLACLVLRPGNDISSKFLVTHRPIGADPNRSLGTCGKVRADQSPN